MSSIEGRAQPVSDERHLAPERLGGCSSTKPGRFEISSGVKDVAQTDHGRASVGDRSCNDPAVVASREHGDRLVRENGRPKEGWSLRRPGPGRLPLPKLLLRGDGPTSVDLTRHGCRAPPGAAI